MSHATTDTSDFDPQGKGYLLGVHVLHRGWDAGSILGAALVCPIIAYRLRTRSSIMHPLLKALGVSACAGTALAGALGVGRVASEGMNQEAIEERVYKLHHNASQNRVDVFSGVGAGLGAAAAAAAAGPSVWPLLGGGALGSTLGILAHLAAPVAQAAELPSASAPSKESQPEVSWGDVWFNSLWNLLGPRTDKTFGEAKQKLFAAAPLSGTVLEIGPGHGSTLPYVRSALDGGRIRKYVFFEPNQAMHSKLRENALQAGLVESGDASSGGTASKAGAAPSFVIIANTSGLPAAGFDAAVSSLVLCSVDDVRESACELYRWLKPGGVLLFLEHVADGQQQRAAQLLSRSGGKAAAAEPSAAGAHGRSWKLWVQQSVTPTWKVFTGGCHLDRPTLDALDGAFDSVTVLGVTESMLLPVIYGTARKRA